MGLTIQNFLEARRAAWIDARTKASMTEDDLQDLQQQSLAKFTPENWLPDAAKRAKSISMVTHPSKFSHPDAKTSPVLAKAKQSPDGLLRTGNVSVQEDVSGNAASLDVHKFLTLELSDGQTVLEHLQQQTNLIKDVLSIHTATFEQLRDGFLCFVSKPAEATFTDAKVKQVYFPVDNGYHLLSILTPSGILFDLYDRIQAIRFSDETTQARDDRKEDKHNEQGYDSLYDLATISFGGSQSQNISMLNNRYRGKALLLSSMPPRLEKRKVHLPRYDFFTDTLWAGQHKKSFSSFHKLLAIHINNIDIRCGRDKCILTILDQVVEKAWEIRDYRSGWSLSSHYQHLPHPQKVWLDNHYQEERDSSDEWLTEIQSEFAHWFIRAYEKNLKERGFILEHIERQHIEKLIKDHKGAWL